MSATTLRWTLAILVALMMVGAPAMSSIASAGGMGGKEAAMEKAKEMKVEKAEMEKEDIEELKVILDDEDLLGELLEELGLVEIEKKEEKDH